MAAACRLVLARWSHDAPCDGSVLILPDGCRDIVLRLPPDGPPRLLVSPLDRRPRRVPVRAGERFTGLRLRPGAAIDERAIAAVPEAERASALAGEGLAEAAARLDPDLAEALDALGQADTPSGAVRALRVSPRTLQRLVSGRTGRTPGWWRRLARARRAGRAVLLGEPLAQVAAAQGYADQAHMTRELRAWLGAPPGALRRGGPAAARLLDPGYDGGGATGEQISTRWPSGLAT